MTRGPITTIRELNECAELFWARQAGLMQGRLENRPVREAAFAAMKAEWEKGVPLRFQKSLEDQLALSAEAYDRAEEQMRNALSVSEMSASTNQLAELGARYREAQRARAKKARGKITEDGRTLSQIIGDFVLRAEHHDQLTKELWPQFFAELEQLELSPKEMEHPTDLSKSAYRFCNNKGKARKIAYGRFANIVSRVRQQKKSR